MKISQNLDEQLHLRPLLGFDVITTIYNHLFILHFFYKKIFFSPKSFICLKLNTFFVCENNLANLKNTFKCLGYTNYEFKFCC